MNTLHECLRAAPISLRTVLLATMLLATALSTALSAQQRIDLDGIWQIKSEQEPDASYQPIHVPGAFETVLGQNFDGVARYRLRLPLPKDRTDRVLVEFDAVATHAQVLINGHRVAEHLGGWTPFRADLTRHVRWDGNDTLEVIVDERVGHNTQGFLPIIQPHFGGIWQSVTLCCNDSPTIDRQRLFVFGNGSGEVTVTTESLPARRKQAAWRIEVLDGDRVVASQTREDRNTFQEPLQIENVKLWRPGAPHLYTARLSLLVDNVPVDVVTKRFGCRSLVADGTLILWNGSPLQMRGLLHWGYSPPQLAPPIRAQDWRTQLEYFRSLGFNTIKCCLWVPPQSFYELCDELGLLVWQEYPTWHPQMDQAHKQELLREYDEFFRCDRSHPSVAFRSITCETGQGADLDVVTALFEACKNMVPDTLVVDDSSWIGWQRITDFWDEHPYGNNSWFPDRLKHFQKHIADHGQKPLLLGECIAADTWVDRPAWLLEHGEQDLWWRPLCWNAQRDAEAWLQAEFGSELVATLNDIALQFGRDNRRFQVEQLRLKIPEAGYVVSVARDFSKARMGLLDDLDRPKWSASDWQWQRDTMLCLDHGISRTVAPGDGARVSVSLAHFGAGTLTGKLRVQQVGEPMSVGESVIESLPPGITDQATWSRQQTTATAQFSPLGPQSNQLERIRVAAELTGTHAAAGSWDLWHFPGNHDVPNRDQILEAEVLTVDLIAQMEAGARVFLQVKDRAHSLRTESMWFLKGAPFAPKHPIHELLPAQCLIETSSFDLESGRVIPWAPWQDQVDPMLAFWETHDIDQVRFHLHAFDTNVGKGRLLATSLKHSAGPRSFGNYVADCMRDHLINGPAPKRSLTKETIQALKAKLHERTIHLPTWRFRMDPDNLGLAANWQDPKLDVTNDAWRDLKAGSHWENQGDDLKHFTGVAWYRVDIDVPEEWRGIDARCVLEGVDDSFHLWLNGELIGVFGDEANKVTIWLEQQVAELQQRLRPGERNTIVLRVVDHAGAGGLWKPVRLTTGPVGAAQKLLR